MRRLVAMLAILLSLLLTAGSMAHAMEPVICIEGEVASAFGHFDGDGDEVPSDDGKAAPHHHASCHGHHMVEPASEGGSGLFRMGKSLPGFGHSAETPSALAVPISPPPRA
ncbi:MAG TPA: hypothetical protein VNR60_12870 [Croceibacterium sp.]|nr:hypothetical protein [Croceibacterium sp.]